MKDYCLYTIDTKNKDGSSNCPNCGAPVDWGRDFCSYCGTLIHDFSKIEMDRPCFLRLRCSKGTMTVKVMLKNVGFRIEDGLQIDGEAETVCSFASRYPSGTLDMNFEIVPHEFEEVNDAQ